MTRTVIIGGTGTLGRELARQIPASEKITVFSRDELKQQQMRREFPHITYRIGDIRDAEAVRRVIVGADRVFLLAAIKHIDVAEVNPLEAIKTNVLGVVNVGEAALDAGVPHVIFSNTDKAVLPITTYGYTKALAQNYLLSMNGQGTRFVAFNWGNVIASRGSVIGTFVRSLCGGGDIKITDPSMSRFWITIESAAKFMLDNYATAPTDRAMIPPMKGALVTRVADSVARCLAVGKRTKEIVGLRCVEKMHEVLESNHSGCLRSDTCEQYTDDELDAMIRPVIGLAMLGGQ